VVGWKKVQQAAGRNTQIITKHGAWDLPWRQL
jgi:hypothetical protein